MTSILSVDTGTVSTDSLQTLIDDSIPNLISSFNTVESTMNNLKGNANVAILTISGTPSVQEQNQAVVDFVAAIDDIIASILEITGEPDGILAQMLATVPNLITSVDQIVLDMDALKVKYCLL